MRTLRAQVPFLANEKLDVLGYEVDTMSHLNQARSDPTRKARIDFNDNWPALRPTEFNVRWPPAEAESVQAVQRNIADTLILVISQRGWKNCLTNDEMRWVAEVSGTNCNHCTSHRIDAVLWALSEFFDQYLA
ncbi:hypothetical protein ATB98_00730 [Sinorhizobium saheli]|uniref:Uncharacterized protein n=1 Tax=Sinorhizobium saheli TaxID=36856 RepID=A0A178XWG1_SINSA|nr:hypothetical protein ATB98_00730 [Sinorhizobium saheli]